MRHPRHPRCPSGWSTTIGAALVAAVLLVATARPAEAHALLLSSDPAPQSTASSAPEAVRLEFSEKVEPEFAKITVLDTDGTRVDSGEISRSDEGRVLSVGVAGTRRGTFTVTWQVVSADGHPVHGAFVYYVGSLSKSPASAATRGADSRHLLAWSYGVARFAWFGFLFSLIGVVLFRRFIWRPAARSVALLGTDSDAAVRRATGVVLPSCGAGLVAAGLGVLALHAATVSGRPVIDSMRPSLIEQVLRTDFGHAWMVQMVAVLAALVAVVRLGGGARSLPGPPDAWVATLGTSLVVACAATSWSGHAHTGSHPLVSTAVVTTHLLAAAVWVGGLGSLIFLGDRARRLARPDIRSPLLRELVVRFGRVALVASAAVATTGAIAAATQMSSPSQLWRVAYGRVVAAKLAMVILALALAARHRFVTPARLASQGAAGARAVRAFATYARIELGVLATALALAAALVVLVPGRSLNTVSGDSIDLDRRAGPYSANLLIYPGRPGTNEVHLTFTELDGRAAAEVERVSAQVVDTSGTHEVETQLAAPGHFVGSATLAAGAGTLAVTIRSGRTGSVRFRFVIGKALH